VTLYSWEGNRRSGLASHCRVLLTSKVESPTGKAYEMEISALYLFLLTQRRRLDNGGSRDATHEPIAVLKSGSVRPRVCSDVRQNLDDWNCHKFHVIFERKNSTVVFWSFRWCNWNRIMSQSPFKISTNYSNVGLITHLFHLPMMCHA